MSEASGKLALPRSSYTTLHCKDHFHLSILYRQMFTVILLVILALGFSYFATLNTQPATVTIPGYPQLQIPLYILMGTTLILGLSFFWIISLINSLSVAMKLRSKDHVIKDAKATIHDLTHRINKLEIENAKLTERAGKVTDPDSI